MVNLGVVVCAVAFSQCEHFVANSLFDFTLQNIEEILPLFAMNRVEFRCGWNFHDQCVHPLVADYGVQPFVDHGGVHFDVYRIVSTSHQAGRFGWRDEIVNVRFQSLAMLISETMDGVALPRSI